MLQNVMDCGFSLQALRLCVKPTARKRLFTQSRKGAKTCRFKIESPLHESKLCEFTRSLQLRGNSFIKKKS
jgi:hypothetical protein